jgi:biopolymer transport protein ExbD
LNVESRKAGLAIECPACHALQAVPTLEQLGKLAEAEELKEPSKAARELPSGAPDQPAAERAIAKRSLGEAPEVPPASTKRAPEPENAPTPNFKAETDIAANEPALAAFGDSDGDERGITLRRARSDSDEMDLTPMVDVTFLLLIFFMITASFSMQKTLQFPPPEPEERGARQAIQSDQQLLSTSVEVEIDEKNTIYIDKERLDAPEKLIDTLLDRMRAGQKTELLLKVNAAAMHESVVKVVDAANDVGMQKIRIAMVGGAPAI